MTPQELKNRILQLAIQGRLVEQRPEEGTGEALYQQIQAEKQALIKAGKIKKEKPLPEITEDEVPFEIPESWKWVPLELIATVNGGYAFKSTDYVLEGVRVIRISDFNENGFVNTKVVRHPYSKELEPFLLEEKNILLCMTGGTVGKSCFVNTLHEIMVVNQRVATIKINTVVPEFINYNILAPLIQAIIQHSKNSTNDNISIDTIKSFPIPLPPLAEQQRIVAKIEELLPLIDRYEKAWTKLEDFNKRFPGDMQKSILQLAIQGRLVEQRPEEGTGEELYQQIQAEKQALIKAGKIKKEKPLPEITEDDVPFDIPESWKWVRLVELGCFSSGKTPTMGEAKYWSNGTVDWFTSKDMKKKYLDRSEMKITELAAAEMAMYPAGTLLMVVRSGILKRMLPLCILTQESTINQDIKAYRLFDLSVSEYVYYMIKGLETHILENYRKQVTTVDSLKFDEFSREMLVPLPPLAEQKRIVAKLEELLPLCERLK